MPRKAKIITCTPQQRKELETIVRQKTRQARQVERAGIILMCLDGVPIKDIAKRYGVRPNTVISIRDRFEMEGLKALYDRLALASLPSMERSFVQPKFPSYCNEAGGAIPI